MFTLKYLQMLFISIDNEVTFVYTSLHLCIDYVRWEAFTMFLCVCKGVRVSEAVNAARMGARSPQALINKFGLEDDECCGRCAGDIVRLTSLVNEELAKAGVPNGVVQYNGALGYL